MRIGRLATLARNARALLRALSVGTRGRSLKALLRCNLQRSHSPVLLGRNAVAPDSQAFGQAGTRPCARRFEHSNGPPRLTAQKLRALGPHWETFHFRETMGTRLGHEDVSRLLSSLHQMRYFPTLKDDRAHAVRP